MVPEATSAVTYEDVLYEVTDGVGLLTLNRPDRRNAMRLQLMYDIEDVLARANVDPAVRALVVTGAGDSFCVGADLAGPDSLIVGMVDDTIGHTARATATRPGASRSGCSRMRIPVIAAINGDVVGGGATISAAMDVRIAAKTARFGFVFTRRGVVPEGASTWYLPRIVGHARATDWLLQVACSTRRKHLRPGWSPAWSRPMRCCPRRSTTPDSSRGSRRPPRSLTPSA